MSATAASAKAAGLPTLPPYEFRLIDRCNMCGDPVVCHKVLGLRMNRSQGFRPAANTGICTTVLRCARCRLIYTHPQPVPQKIEDHYGVPPEEYWQEVSYKPAPDYFAWQLDRLRYLCPPGEGVRALDIGAGLGQCMQVLQGAGYDTWGIEASPVFRRKAIEKAGIDGARLQPGMVEDAEFAPGFFDFITFGAVLEHLYDPGGAIATAMGWLKPGGVVYIEVPYSDRLQARLLNLYYRLHGTRFVTNTSPMSTPYHLYEFHPQSFKLHGLQHGYTIEEQKIHICEIYHVPRLLHPLLKGITRLLGSGDQITLWLRKSS